MESPKDDIIPPVPLAFLLCDQVIDESRTGKKTLVGVFNHISANKFPINYGPCTLYFRGADCQGNFVILVRYAQTSTSEVLAEAEAKMGSNQRGDMEFALTLPPFKIPSPGRYEFQLYMNGRYLHRLHFTAEQISPNKED
jgi:hypothetical protein